MILTFPRLVLNGTGNKTALKVGLTHLYWIKLPIDFGFHYAQIRPLCFHTELMKIIILPLKYPL